VGFAPDKAGFNRHRWGQNLLGKALMSVRERVKEEEKEKGERIVEGDTRAGYFRCGVMGSSICSVLLRLTHGMTISDFLCLRHYEFDGCYVDSFIV